jgi:peptidoglycan/LPS O-acetylase OafA/YrhL
MVPIKMKFFGFETLTLEDKLKEHQGVGPGFDAIRVYLSITIMALHSLTLAKGAQFYIDSPAWIHALALSLLPAFFGLGGFLVTGSGLRLKSVSRFIWHRILRIFPALALEVFLSAIFLGAIFTTLNLSSYFSSTEFWVYFKNILGIINFNLPGVFLDNPFPRTVNGNLWTLRPDYYGYLILACLMLLGVFSRKNIYFYLLLIGLFGSLGLDLITEIGKPDFIPKDSALVFSFLFGSLLFLKADIVPWRFDILLACLAFYLFLGQHGGLSYLSSACVVYVIVYIGLVKIPMPSFLKSGDYSYGIYLYGFPIQQALVAYFLWTREWYILFPISPILALALAIISWHYIEKPFLRLKYLGRRSQAVIV